MTYQWRVIYKNNDSLYQDFESAGEKHFGNIEQDRLSIFEIYSEDQSYSVNVETGEFSLDGSKIFFGNIPRGEEYRLIYFRRIKQALNGVTEDSSIRHCFGIQCTVDGVNQQALIWVDDRTKEVEITTKR